MAQITPVRGVNRILLMRPFSLRHQVTAGRMAFQTNHEKSITRDAESTITKDGNIHSLSEVVVEYSLTTLMAHNDEVRAKMYEGFLNGELIELWDIDKTEEVTPGSNQFLATYFQGYITEWSETAGAEDSVEISLSIAVNGSGVRGNATLTEDQATVVQYEFADTIVAV
ncbi:MAG: phage major tail protein, TP901-1 family [Defluviitaleaceae bacterium]|nr:phage major tail protein, TP901-1 family [Defluviitaleaceae bacterium]